MFLISNRQYDEVIEMLTAYVQTDGGTACSLREYNRYRRARLLIKALSKRKPIECENNISNNPKNK